jgi:hypothetical protein
MSSKKSSKRIFTREELDDLRLRKVVTDEELAAHLHEGIETIHTWRRAEIIPVIKLGYRTLRYNIEAVEAALLRREVKAKGRRQ